MHPRKVNLLTKTLGTTTNIVIKEVKLSPQHQETYLHDIKQIDKWITSCKCNKDVTPPILISTIFINKC